MIMDKIKVKVNAKINLSLDVLGLYNGGYHELDMVMASIGIYDVVKCEKSNKITVKMNGKLSNEHNTAYKVCKLCYETYGVGLMNVSISKRIPFSAGLGGSSADASAVLFCIGRLYGLTYEQLYPIACKVGSDVVFMMNGGIMRAKGKGDDLLRLPFHDYYLVVAKGKHGTRTKDVFDEYDKSPEKTNYTESYVNAKNNLERYSSIKNALYNASKKCNGEIEETYNILKKYSDIVCMSGSGASCFAVFDSIEKANDVANSIRCENYANLSYVKACRVQNFAIKEIT